MYIHTYHRATSCLQSLAQDLQYLVSKNERGGEGGGRGEGGGSKYRRKESKRYERREGTSQEGKNRSFQNHLKLVSKNVNMDWSIEGLTS